MGNNQPISMLHFIPSPTSTRIFILAPKSLFGVGLELWLKSQTGIVVIGQGTELHSVQSAIRDLCPDLILVVRHSHADDPGLCMEKLFELTQVRVATVDLESNDLSIYPGAQQSIKRLDSLIEVIHERTIAAI